jgi:uncharacterized delta-60 repeat protein
MRVRTVCHCFLLTVSLLLTLPSHVTGQAGQLDPSFGQGGIVTTDFGSGGGTANAVAIQPDGKIVVCGGVGGSTGFPIAAVARYNPDGSLDTGFGTAGITSVPGILNVPSSIALQSDGKIVVAAFYNQITVMRFKANGYLDSTFGNYGVFSTGFLFSSGRQSGVGVLPDGRIVVAGGPRLLGLLPNGTLDPTFGTAGSAPLAGDAPTALALLSSGKILVAGAGPSTDAGSSSGSIARYNSNGSLDKSFGINGQVGTTGPAYAMVLASGEFLLAGNLASSLSISVGPTVGFAVSRYQGFGAVDGKFAIHGGVVTPIAGFPVLLTSGVGVQSSGDIVTLATATATAPPQSFALARYTPNGQLDPTFGAGGTVVTSFSGASAIAANGLAIQPDGNIVAVGSFTIYGNHGQVDSGFKLIRYLGR